MRNAAMSMLVLVLAWVGAAAGSHPEGVDELAVKVMSFNVRYGTANDGDDHWLKRRELLLETIQAYGPDLLGTQETLAMQRDWLSERLPKFACWAAGRDDGAEKGEMAAMYWNTDRFAKLDGGHFWLSPTPEQVGSKGWDAALPRIVSWVKLQDKKRPDAVPVYFFNTHFDHRGREARLESARLLRRRVGELAGDGSVIVAGDFNCAEGSPPYRAIFDDEVQPRLVDTYRAVHPERSPDEATFHAFKPQNIRGDRIDWIACSPHWQPTAAAIDRTARAGRAPSDHFPVTATLAPRR